MSKLAFVAGPYRAKTLHQLKRNIDAAGEVALKYWKAGYTVICSHKNTSFFDGELSDEVWLDGALDLLRLCDTVVMMKGWEGSTGAVAEHQEAIRLGKMVIYD